MTGLATVATGTDKTAALLRSTAIARRIGRWLLLPGFVLLPVWAASFGVWDVQVMALGVAFLVCLAAVAFGGTAVAIEVVIGRRWRPEPRGWRGRWLAPLALVLWVSAFALRLDAHVWLLAHENGLRRAVDAVRALPNPPTAPTLHEGFTVQVVGPSRAVVIEVGREMNRCGIAFDPDHVLHTGLCREIELEFADVRDLRGPWRCWVEDF